MSKTNQTSGTKSTDQSQGKKITPAQGHQLYQLGEGINKALKQLKKAGIE